MAGSRNCYIACALLLAAWPACATVLMPGQGDSGPSSGYPLDQVFVYNFNTMGAVDGNCGPVSSETTCQFTQVVIADPNNTFCPNCLDFAFVVELNSIASYLITQLTLGLFAGFSTDVAYPPGLIPAGIDPTSGGRSADGQDILYYFPTGSTIGAGQGSQVLIVETNATNYNNLGTLNLQDSAGDSTTVSGLYSPASVPEPSTTLLVSLGILLVGFRRK